MKLRHRASGVTVEGDFKEYANSYWNEKIDRQHSYYTFAEWERVPEERWVDVTHEVEVNESYGHFYFCHKDFRVSKENAYRLRKTVLGTLVIERKELV